MGGWRPVATSYNHTVPSLLASARSFPSGLNATDRIKSVGPVRVRPVWQPAAISLTARAIVPAGGQSLPVRAERHRINRAGEAREGVAGYSPQPSVPSSLPLAVGHLV